MRTGFFFGLFALALTTTARADPPDFDQPGAGFATSVLPFGTLALEQGLPTYTRQSGGGLLDRQYSANSLIRIGLGGPAELQIGGSAWNRLEERGQGVRRYSVGHGDSSLGLKLAPTLSGDFSWSALGVVTFANGDQDFSNGARQYTLGATAQWAINERYVTTLYANVDRLRGRNTWTLAPTFGVNIAQNWMVYGEFDAIHSAQDGNEFQAGGGAALSVTDHVQLDAYALHRIGAHGPSVIAGLGISIFFDRR
ncbi:outer membrane putative beta-barrel porin/alpha-amylase [Luteibacter rhizovicinus]|uniref:Outer membrane putative beta-barrel porin/alpha-amylase n=1 Tax=Luteibacter rhizovicinus TaxID=242606 RepID=A0A4R3YJX3_9GAMM|nr:transporter [Luteibacter rhizovicinus]TCV92767.1 outer membrane putative beta-barrel porin/alpha-amylase [Luteibacter rhizovicinus]